MIRFRGLEDLLLPNDGWLLVWGLGEIMKNAFEVLGLEPSLVLGEESLRAAFLRSGKEAHPDAGGGEGEFERLKEAREILSSPCRRLRHWLELRGTPVDVRGPVDAAMMDLFAEVGAVTQRTEAVLRKREEAKSALGLAMVEGETQVCREMVEKAIRQVEEAIGRESAVFPAFEGAAEPDVAVASRVARNLAFLEKWRAGLRGLFSRLV
jgi:curved DNA-binding protein CbpA